MVYRDENIGENKSSSPDRRLNPISTTASATCMYRRVGLVIRSWDLRSDDFDDNPAAVGSVQLMKSVVLPSGSITFS